MSVSVPAILKYLSNNSYNIMGDSENSEGSSRAKKRRLDHLTWEEKIQRKKLKNRVAAQTSRDRKKAKMEQMEQVLKDLCDKNTELAAECERLRETNEKILTENRNLHDRMQRVSCPTCSNQSRSVECDGQSGSTATEEDPRPQGLARHSAAPLKPLAATAVLKIVAACLLYQTFLTSSTETSTSCHWKRSHRAFSKISPQTWKLLLKKQIVKNQLILHRKTHWWGKHQKSWNPIEAKA